MRAFGIFLRCYLTVTNKARITLGMDYEQISKSGAEQNPAVVSNDMRAIAAAAASTDLLNVGAETTKNLRYDTGPVPTTPLNLLRAIEKICEEVSSLSVRHATVRQEQDAIISDATASFLERFNFIAALRLTPEDRSSIDLHRDLVLTGSIMDGYPGDPILKIILKPSDQLVDRVIAAPTTLLNKEDWLRAKEICAASEKHSFQCVAERVPHLLDDLSEFLGKSGMQISDHDKDLLNQFTELRCLYYDALYKQTSTFTIELGSCTVAAQDSKELDLRDAIIERWKDVPVFTTLTSLIGPAGEPPYRTCKLADDVLKNFEDAQIPKKYWSLLKEPELLLRYKEFSTWYKSEAQESSPQKLDGQIGSSELRTRFIHSLGTQVVYRSEAYIPERVERALSWGVRSTYGERFLSTYAADRKVQEYCERYGLARVVLGSVFREDLGNGELLRKKGNTSFVDSVFLSTSSYAGYALGIGRAYACEAVRFGRKAETPISLTCMEVPRFYAIDYAGSSLFSKMAGRNAPIEPGHSYFRDIKTGQISDIDTDSLGGGEVFLRRIQPQWIKSIEIFPLYGSLYASSESEVAGRLGGEVGTGVPLDLERLKNVSWPSRVAEWIRVVRSAWNF